QHQPFVPLAHRKDLPGGEEVEWRADPVGRLDEDVRIVMERMVGRDEDRRALAQGLLHVLDAADVELDDLLAAGQVAIDERPPEADKPGSHPRRPAARRRLKRLTVHGKTAPEGASASSRKRCCKAKTARGQIFK